MNLTERDTQPEITDTDLLPRLLKYHVFNLVREWFMFMVHNIYKMSSSLEKKKLRNFEREIFNCLWVAKSTRS